LLAAGEMATLAVPERRQRRKDRLDALARPPGLLPAQREHRDPEVFRRGQVREDAAVVRNVAHAERGEPFRGLAGDRLLGEPHGAPAPGDVEPGETAQRGRLAHAVAAEE